MEYLTCDVVLHVCTSGRLKSESQAGVGWSATYELKFVVVNVQDLSTGWLHCDPGPLFRPMYHPLPAWVPHWVRFNPAALLHLLANLKKLSASGYSTDIFVSTFMAV